MSDPQDAPSALIPLDIVGGLVACRNAAIASYGAYFDAMEAAQEHLTEAHAHIARGCGTFSLPFVPGQLDEIKAFDEACQVPNVANLKATAERLTDGCFWEHAVVVTDLRASMDATSRKELRDQMEYQPLRPLHSRSLVDKKEQAKQLPPFTIENVEGTLAGFAANAHEIFRRGVARALSGLSKKFKSHDGHGYGDRIIFTNAFYDGRWNNQSDEVLRDVERACLVIDGKRPSRDGIIEQINRERENELSVQRVKLRSSLDTTVHHGEYFRVRIFGGNGNAHIWFERKDIVEKINLLLADEYSIGYGADYEDDVDPDVEADKAMKRAPAKNFGLFVSQEPVVERVYTRAWLNKVGRHDGPERVLEPSAGTGALSSRAANHGHLVDVVEIQSHLHRDLAATGLYERCYHRDFLTMTPRDEYDYILMNPPFDRGRDIDHVIHAIKFLAKGGTLVAVMSASACYGQGRKAVAFRKLVKTLKGSWHDLPAGSFAPCNVNTVTLKLKRRQ